MTVGTYTEFKHPVSIHTQVHVVQKLLSPFYNGTGLSVVSGNCVIGPVYIRAHVNATLTIN